MWFLCVFFLSWKFVCWLVSSVSVWGICGPQMSLRAYLPSTKLRAKNPTIALVGTCSDHPCDSPFLKETETNKILRSGAFSWADERVLKVRRTRRWKAGRSYVLYHRAYWFVGGSPPIFHQRKADRSNREVLMRVSKNHERNDGVYKAWSCSSSLLLLLLLWSTKAWPTPAGIA